MSQVGPDPDPAQLYCPSAQPDMDHSVVFGVVGGPPDAPRVRFLAEPQPVSRRILKMAEPVQPTEVFRFGAPCARNSCQHFDGSKCGLATRIRQSLPAVTEDLPACRLRPQCLWFHQEGGAACQRCPQVVTLTYNPTEKLIAAATPATNCGPDQTDTPSSG